MGRGIVLIVLLFSCSETIEVLRIESQNVSPILSPYLNSFVEKGNKRGVNIEVPENYVLIFSDTLSVYGLSIQDTRGNKSVFIDVSVNQKPNYFIEYVVFHELGHSLLGLKHEDCYCIMNEDAFLGASVYQQHKEQLLDQLFNYGQE